MMVVMSNSNSNVQYYERDTPGDRVGRSHAGSIRVAEKSKRHGSPRRMCPWEFRFHFFFCARWRAVHEYYSLR